MIDVDSICVTRRETIREALRRLDVSGTGVLLLVDTGNILERTVTDGDIRRLLLDGVTLDDRLDKLAPLSSIVLHEGYTKQSALELMGRHQIDHLPVVDRGGKVIRLLGRKEIDEQILLSTPHLGDLEREFVEEAFSSNWIAPLGPNVDAFERELAEMVGVDHAAAVSSGTAAIHLALLLLNVQRGDVVFCSALTFAASANPIVYQGAEPVFIDSEPGSWNMSPLALERALEDARTRNQLPRAVIVVNLYGQSADMDPIMELCSAYGVPIVEDAAESLGAKYKNRPSGSFGRIGVFSFNGNKIITTSGGGMLVSDDKDLVARARFLATQAREPAMHYEHTTIGYNYRMSNILAGVGRGQLRVLGDRVSARRRIFDRYAQGLAHVSAIRWMPEPPWSFANRWLSVCAVEGLSDRFSRESIIRRLAAERIEARPVWKPMQMQPVFAGCRFFAHADQSVSEDFFQRGICLPSGSNMTDAQQDQVIEVLERIFRTPGGA